MPLIVLVSAGNCLIAGILNTGSENDNIPVVNKVNYAMNVNGTCGEMKWQGS